MKQFFVILMIAVLVLPKTVFGDPDIKKGDITKVRGWEWVVVKNPRPVPSGNNLFSYGDECGIQEGGTIKVVGIDSDYALVRYSIKNAQYGSPCPSGIVFFVMKARFSKMMAEDLREATAKKIAGERRKAAESGEKELIKKLLNDE